MNKNKMPPLGVEPEYIWRTRRVIALLDAMERYAEAKEPIPVKWIDELRKHVIVKADKYPQYGSDATAACGTPPYNI